MENPTILFEMSDESRLAFFDSLLEKEMTGTISKQKDAVKGRPGELPPIGFDAVWHKGWTRMWNDGNGGKDVARNVQIETGQKRFADFCNGVVTARGPGLSDHETIMHRIARADWIDSLPKDERSAARQLDASETRVKTAARIAADPDKYAEAATVQIFVDAAVAVAKATAYAAAMTDIAKNKADAAKLQETLDNLDKN